MSPTLAGTLTRPPRRPGITQVAGFLVLSALVAFGVFGYAQQRLHGDIVTGLRTIGSGGAVWGLYIVFDIVLAGFAFAGIAIATLGRIFRLRELHAFTRMSLLTAVVALMLAGLCVLADLGRPLHGLMNLPRYARPQSPFFGTFTMIIGAGLTASVVQLFLSTRADAAACARHARRPSVLYRLWACGYSDTAAERRRRRITSLLLAVFIFPLMVVAYSTLGFVFGIQSGRPGWFSALQAPSFLVLAALSGTGLILFIAGVARRRYGERLSERAFRWLGNTLLVLLLIYLYFLAVEELTARYAAPHADTVVARAVDSGVYAPIFWTSVGLFVASTAVLLRQFVRRRYSLPALMAIGLAVNVAAILKRLLVVVPSQTHGLLLAYPSGTYAPTWVELAVVVGLLALGALLFLLFGAVFPLVPLQPIGPVVMPRVPVTRPQRRLVRLTLFASVLAAGLVLALVGLLASARVGTEPTMDPVLPLSPVVFIIGLVLAMGAAVVYETVPRALPPAPRAEGVRDG